MGIVSLEPAVGFNGRKALQFSSVFRAPDSLVRLSLLACSNKSQIELPRNCAVQHSFCGDSEEEKLPIHASQYDPAYRLFLY